jgi:carbonic anhydrase/acetyltransferase-like protein (isoleucine patch superfamily)
MKAYVVARGQPIAPFGEPAARLEIGLRPWGEAQADLLRSFGLEVVPVARLEDVPGDAPRVVTFDDVYFTRRVLKSLLALWKKAGQPASQVGLPSDSCFVRQFSDLLTLRAAEGLTLYDLYALPAGADLADARPLAVVFKEREVRVPIPAQVTGHEAWVHPITTSVCLHLEHWLHVLQASRLAIQVAWVDAVVARPWWGAWLVLKALWPGRGRLLWRLLGRANRIGRGVDIHPTARVEGCIIGDGAKIGAQALVRGALIGAGAVLEDRCNVAYSVVGPRSFVSKYTLIYTSALMAEANVGMSMQMCLVGRRAALTPRATPIDVQPGGKVRVKHKGAFVPVDLPVLGSCYGHDTFVGADVYIGAGRALPNGTRLGPAPERVLRDIPDEVDPEAVYVVRDGALVPLRRG